MRLRWIAIIGALAAGAALRISFIPNEVLDSDMTVTGLMAMHILRGDLPVFFWGQPYCGSIEAFVVAAIFALTGPSKWALCLGPVVISLGFALVCYGFAREAWGERAAVVGMWLVALAPYYLVGLGVVPRAAYIETPVFSLVLMWLAWRAVHRSGGRGLYFLYGLVAGVGLWTHFLIIYALVASGLYILAHERLGTLRRVGWILLGVAVGGAPLWIYNILNDWATFCFLARSGREVGPWEALKGFLLQGLPTMIGAWKDGTLKPLWGPWGWGVLGLGIASAGYVLFEARRSLWALVRGRPREGDGSELFILMILVMAVVVSAFGENAASTRRHFAPVYAALLPLGAYCFERLWARRRWLGVVWLVGVLAANLGGAAWANPSLNPARRARHQAVTADDARIVSHLLASGFSHVWMPDYWQSMRLSFAAKERVIFAEPFFCRNRGYTREALADPTTPWVFRRPAPDFEAVLKAMGAIYRVERVGPFWIFRDIAPPPYRLEPVVPDGWEAAANPPMTGPEWAIDRRASSRWSTLAPQAPGQWFDLDLGRVVEGVCMVRLHQSTYVDAPVHLVVMGSVDGKHWRKLAELKRYWGPCFWAGGRVITRWLMPAQDIFFTPTALRYLRLRQLGLHPSHYWSIQEVQLWRAAGPGQWPALEPGALARWLKGRPGITRVVSDPCTMARLWPRWQPGAGEVKVKTWWEVVMERARVVQGELKGVAIAVAPHEAGDVEYVLRREGISFHRDSAGGYEIFYELRWPAPPRTVRPQGLKATAFWGQPALAIDRNPTTRWSSGRPMDPGQWWAVQWKGLRGICGLVIDGVRSPMDLPLSPRVELLTLQGWQACAYRWRAGKGGLALGQGVLMSLAPGRVTLLWPRVEARGVRLKPGRPHRYYFYSMHEVMLRGCD